MLKKAILRIAAVLMMIGIVSDLCIAMVAPLLGKLWWLTWVPAVLVMAFYPEVMGFFVRSLDED